MYPEEVCKDAFEKHNINIQDCSIAIKDFLLYMNKDSSLEKMINEIALESKIIDNKINSVKKLDAFLKNIVWN